MPAVVFVFGQGRRTRAVLVCAECDLQEQDESSKLMRERAGAHNAEKHPEVAERAEANR